MKTNEIPRTQPKHDLTHSTLYLFKFKQVQSIVCKVMFWLCSGYLICFQYVSVLKKCNMKKAQHEKSATLKKCNMGILEAQPGPCRLLRWTALQECLTALLAKVIDLFLTTRQIFKIRNALANNMSTDVKFSEVKLSRIIQSEEFICALLGKSAGPLMKVVVPWVRNVLAPSGTMAFAIDGANQRMMHGRGVERPGKGITLVISNNYMNYDII